jgi:hypothetical protein
VTAESFIASLFVSGAGYVLFSYGKKLQRLPQLACGVVLMVFPYFVSNVALMLGIAAAVGGALWVGLKLGL